MREIKLIQSIDNTVTATSQKFTIPNTGQQRLGFWFKYSSLMDRWFFYFFIDDEAVLCGQKVVLDTNLLAPYSFGVGAIMAIDVTGTGQMPNYEAITSRAVRLYHYTEEEVVSLLYPSAGNYT